MKRFLLSILLSALTAGAAAQYGDEGWFVRNYRKTEHRIVMRDGTELHTAVYSPVDTTEAHPILMTRTPYGCAPYGDGVRALWRSKLESAYAAEGYILVFQDVRGRWMSGGEFVNIRPFIENKAPGQVDEASDVYDTVEWLVENIPHNNGRVGVKGNSYNGFYSTMAAASRHPAIRAVSPQAPVYDWYMGDDFHHNGALALQPAVQFAPTVSTPRDEPTPSFRPRRLAIPDEGTFEYYLSHTVAGFTDMLGSDFEFWRQIVEHPDYDDWWRERCAERACRGIEAAVLVVGGTYDAEDCYGAWKTYDAICRLSPESDCRLVMGAWSHGAWQSHKRADAVGDIVYGSGIGDMYRERIEVPFFNFYLKDKGCLDSLPRTMLFFSGENRWRSFDRWREPGRRMTLYLDADGSLSRHRPARSGGCTSYISDPADPVPYMPAVGRSIPKGYMNADQRFASERGDVLTFCGERLDRPISVAGEIGVRLYASLSTTDADFVVKLIDCSPDGRQTLIRGDIIRGRYRNGFTQGEPFEAGRIEQVRLTMPGIAHTFLEGHRIMVQIQSTWFPLFDRNPQQMIDIYRCGEHDFVPCRVSIYHSRRYPSSVELGIVE